MSYYADFWQVFGLTPLTIWQIPFDEFTAMAGQVDKLRKEAKPNG